MRTQREATPAVLAVIGTFLILPTVLFASVGLWAAMAAGIVGVLYLFAAAFAKWRTSSRQR